MEDLTSEADAPVVLPRANPAEYAARLRLLASAIDECLRISPVGACVAPRGLVELFPMSPTRCVEQVLDALEDAHTERWQGNDTGIWYLDTTGRFAGLEVRVMRHEDAS